MSSGYWVVVFSEEEGATDDAIRFYDEDSANTFIRWLRLLDPESETDIDQLYVKQRKVN